jgi:RNA 3'-terminal phosphate cyclase (ATP)
MLLIDGSRGEGGGQLLRTSLALSLVTGAPFQISRIRAGRSKPGLLRQHLTAVQASAAISGAQVEGAQVGSRELTFIPGPVRGGDYAFAVGTAGSATLVLQTVLPALLLQGGTSRLTLEGGTHNPMAPPFDALDRCFLPLLRRMGAQVSAQLERPGFYPAGGGRFRVQVESVPSLSRLELLHRGEVRGSARALVAGLPYEIGKRELGVVRERMGFAPESLQVEQPEGFVGNALMIELQSEAATELFTGFGERGVAAEQVAARAVDEAQAYLKADVPVGEHLADQLLLPIALAGGGAFRTVAPSSHTCTQAETIGLFLGVKFRMEPVSPLAWLVELM